MVKLLLTSHIYIILITVSFIRN